MPAAALVLCLAAAADFLEDARALEDRLLCRAETATTAQETAEYCTAVLPTFEWYRNKYVRVATPFLRALRPVHAPDVAVQIASHAELLSTLAAYGDLRELTSISRVPAGDPRKKISLARMKTLVPDLLAATASNESQLPFVLISFALHGYELRGFRYFRILPDGALEYLDGKVSPHAELIYGRPGDPAEHILRHILATDPSVRRHLENKGEVLALVKGSGAGTFRNYLLTHMTFMFSDATGVPPSVAGRAGFSQQAFGHLHGGASQEMIALWSAPATKVLPFRFGNVDADQHFQLLVTQRAPLPPVATKPWLEGERAGGKHWRLWTKHGAVHVWRPPNYHHATAGVVYYLHGYYVNADGAWDEYRLAEQFAAANKNALYIVPEASAGDYEGPFWEDPAELLAVVTQKTKVKTPPGPKIVLAHSGGFRTAGPWTKTNTPLRQIQLIDGLYGSQMLRFKEWVQEPGHQLILTSTDTAPRSEMLAAEIAGSKTRETIPGAPEELTAEEMRSPLLFMRSQYGHMELVTEGRVIPFLLQLAPLHSTVRDP